ncbi:MAG: hypothetical protein ACLPX7_21025 [Xanthobacteraceae bacterium]
MTAKSLRTIAGFALLSWVGIALPALAQTSTPGGPPRIEVNPQRLLYRRCTSWYVVQYRPSGRVLFPEKHCWWVRG